MGRYTSNYTSDVYDTLINQVLDAERIVDNDSTDAALDSPLPQPEQETT